MQAALGCKRLHPCVCVCVNEIAPEHTCSVCVCVCPQVSDSSRMPLSPPQPPAFTQVHYTQMDKCKDDTGDDLAPHQQSPEEVKGCPALLSDLSQGTDHPYFRLYQYLHQGAPHKSKKTNRKSYDYIALVCTRAVQIGRLHPVLFVSS